MKGSERASARFAELVKAAGQPHVVTLWTAPEEDREFMEAVRARRVLTVRQETTGTHKDHGEVGFIQDRHASHLYLVFPKSIKAFEGKRVVGIKYDLLAEPKPRGPVASKRPETAEVRLREKKEKPKPQPPAPKPEPRFAVRVERMATASMTIEVTARTEAGARKLALEQAEEKPLDLSGAAVRTRIVAARKMKTNH